MTIWDEILSGDLDCILEWNCTGKNCSGMWKQPWGWGVLGCRKEYFLGNNLIRECIVHNYIMDRERDLEMNFPNFSCWEKIQWKIYFQDSVNLALYVAYIT